MEEESAKLPNNVAGRYYVCERCDGCAYCGGVAPGNFDFDKSSNTYFICRQPETDREIELVAEAVEDCPVDAIIRAADSSLSTIDGPLL